MLEDGYVLPGGPAWGFDPPGAEPVKPNTVALVEVCTPANLPHWFAGAAPTGPVSVSDIVDIPLA